MDMPTMIGLGWILLDQLRWSAAALGTRTIEQLDHANIFNL
jgi:hypothetical protein